MEWVRGNFIYQIKGIVKNKNKKNPNIKNAIFTLCDEEEHPLEGASAQLEYSMPQGGLLYDCHRLRFVGRCCFKCLACLGV